MKTLFTGQQLIVLQETSSTNSYALSLIPDKKLVNGAAIYAISQTSGKGMQGKRWIAEPGQNITVSFYFSPHFLEVKKQFYLSMAMALAVRDCVFSLVNSDAAVRIKWPNDIFVNNKKIAGILIENSLSATQIQHSVVGIGLNVNQKQFDQDLSHATSLSLLGMQVCKPLETVFPILCEYLEKRYLQLMAGKYAELKSDYTQHLYKYGEELHFLEFATGNTFYAIVCGINDQGKLHLKTIENELFFDIKEIKWLA